MGSPPAPHLPISISAAAYCLSSRYACDSWLASLGPYLLDERSIEVYLARGLKTHRCAADAADNHVTGDTLH